MKVAFTLCSNNYLAQASLLIQSFTKHNPGYVFYLVLVDKISQDIKYPVSEQVVLISCEEFMDNQLLLSLAAKYKIVELNTCVKPFFFDYVLKKYNDVEVVYLDPDIYVYHSFDSIEEALVAHDFVLTPHILSPIPLDDQFPSERQFMKFGIYNLGFLALKKSPDTVKFVTWWMDRLAAFCYSETELGVYVDQSWAGFIPCFYPNAHVSHHPGMNAAFWNLHERTYAVSEGQYLVNGKDPLVFFHYSSFNLANCGELAKGGTRYSFDTRKDLIPLFEGYAKEFKEAKQVFTASVPCFYTKRTVKSKMFYYLNRFRIRKKYKI
jgi:hypothetical protein